ncbi:methylisocitrate lyase [Pseudonocardia kujensis]|uniref:methylisocitrate lyase n=1 Tax=Pseudonocardia kujensis TaxID=1128675 RepID=UPI001E5CB3CB|nr:methylisocitrate lyase [Pseudonocardia kujensis]
MLQLPGAFTPLSATLIEEKGFDGVYSSGAVMAAELGLPDIGLTTLTEVSNRVREITRVTELPVIVDADTGFGEVVNLARTVQTLEDAGVAGLHIEDQVNPKRCGHLDGKEVVDTATAVRRIRAAVTARSDPGLLVIARTDLRACAGLPATIERAKALVDAGADMLFPEALASLDEYEAFRRAVDVPILANVTEFGKNELFTATQLESAGVDLAIYPVSLLRLAMGSAERALAVLRAEGTLAGLLPEMLTRSRLYELLRYESYSRFDASVLGFAPSGSSGSTDRQTFEGPAWN